MSRQSVRGVVLATAVGALVLAGVAMSQEQGGRPVGAPGGGGGGWGGRGGWDPAQMQERVLGAVQEAIGATDEEWEPMKPHVEKIIALNDELRPNLFRLMFRGRGRGPGGGMGGGPGGPSGGGMGPQAGGGRGPGPGGPAPAAEEEEEQSDLEVAKEALQAAADDPEATDEDIAAKTAAVREEMGKLREQLVETQKALAELATTRQEAQLVLLSLLD